MGLRVPEAFPGSVTGAGRTRRGRGGGAFRPLGGAAAPLPEPSRGHRELRLPPGTAASSCCPCPFPLEISIHSPWSGPLWKRLLPVNFSCLSPAGFSSLCPALPQHSSGGPPVLMKTPVIQLFSNKVQLSSCSLAEVSWHVSSSLSLGSSGSRARSGQGCSALPYWGGICKVSGTGQGPQGASSWVSQVGGTEAALGWLHLFPRCLPAPGLLQGAERARWAEDPVHVLWDMAASSLRVVIQPQQSQSRVGCWGLLGSRAHTGLCRVCVYHGREIRAEKGVYWGTHMSSGWKEERIVCMKQCPARPR